MSSENHVNYYKVLSYIVFALLTAYIGIGQLILGTSIHKNDTGIFRLFTGDPKLEISQNILDLNLLVATSELELHFTDNFASLGVSPAYIHSSNQNTSSEPYYPVTVIDFNNWHTIRSNKSPSLKGVDIIIDLSNSNTPEERHIFYIDRVRMDSKDISLTDFYYEYIDRSKSNITLFFAADLFNVSAFLAKKYGLSLNIIIIAILLALLTSQLFLFFVSIIWQPQEVADYFNKPDSIKAVSWIDSLSESHAISLGFLGTVISIWLALETGSNQFSDFYGILEILKVAIFTTVLGLSTKMICTIRRYNISMVGKKEQEIDNET